MEIALIAVSILLFGIQSAALKKIQVNSLRENLLTTGASAVIVAAATGILLLFMRTGIAPVTFGFGVVVGVMFMVTLAVYYFAMQSGPLSYTGFFFSASMLIPAAVGLVFWNEPFTLPVQIGILLFLAAFLFITVFGGEKGKKGNRVWLPLCFLTWLCNGSLSVLITLHQRSLGSAALSDTVALLFCAFTVMVIIAVIIFFTGKKEVRADNIKMLRRGLIPLTLVAVGTGGGNVVVSFLSGRIASSYLFPFVQGGTMVFVTLWAMLVLRERTTFIGKIGILIGIAAIIVINL